MKATIWHNPDCGTSRKTLAILQEAKADLTVIDYRKAGFDRAQLASMIANAGLTPQQALRTRGSPAEELGLIDEPDAGRVLDAMVEHPILVERPFVVTDKGARLCRPQDLVHEIL